VYSNLLNKKHNFPLAEDIQNPYFKQTHIINRKIYYKSQVESWSKDSGTSGSVFGSCSYTKMKIQRKFDKKKVETSIRLRTFTF
jgi:hypothetical protein